MAVWMILPGSRSDGMKTTDLRPAWVAWAATELARLPVEAHDTVVYPNARAADSATETTRSLNECVGLPLSSLTSSDFMPRALARLGAGRSLVMPAPRSTRVARSWPAGRSPTYRQML